MKEVFIISAVRTPIGSFNGILAEHSSTRLGSFAIKAALEKAGVKPEQVNDVYMGNVLTANIGQAPARQASRYAGIPDNVPCTTINKVCASGMKAVMIGAQSIMLGDNDIVVAGGMESMTNVPYYLDKARSGYRLGNGIVIDGIVKDGLWDVYKDFHMGNAAELCAKEYAITREEQDAFAIESYRRSANSHSKRLFHDEIVPVEITLNGEKKLISDDEEYKKVNFDKVPKLRPVFQKDGTVTAANASSINDGASALVLVSGEKAKELGLKPIARIVSFADAEQAPEWFTTSPSKALPKVLEKAKMKIFDVDYFEINEAFAVVSIVNNRLMKLDPARVNVFGGAVALGHPIGASGARIITTLLNVLAKNNASVGAAGICNGGGGASAIVVERV